MGLKQIDKDKEIIEYLTNDIEEKLGEIIHKAKTFMRVGKRRQLNVSDLNHSLRLFNQKELYGYESYTTFGDKEEIIDIDEYLRAPMPKYPMKSFGHFHWLTIEGKSPNIPENYISNNKIIYPKTNIDSNLNQILFSNFNETNSRNITNNTKASNINTNQNQTGNTNKVIPLLKHNISKELALFREQFESIFNQEIKMNLLVKDNDISLMKETEINLIVLQTEPGVVNLLPLILDFLFNTISNGHYLSEEKVHMIVLVHLKSIINNQFFFLAPYLSQIISLLLSLILLEKSDCISASLQVKNLSIDILRFLIEKYTDTYPILIKHLLNIFKDHLVPDLKVPMYLTSYGAIRSINTLGTQYIKEIIYPHMEDILKTMNIAEVVEMQEKIEKQHKDFNVNIPNSQGNISLSPAPASPPSLPKYSFTLSFNALAEPLITSSMFAPPSGVITSQVNDYGNTMQQITNTIPKKTVNDKEMMIDNNAIDNTWRLINHKSTSVYYALIESVRILLSSYYDDKEMLSHLSDLFGENLLNFRKDNNELNIMI